MRILYVTTSLLRNESASIRNISLINGLIENNCHVKVITLDYKKENEDNFLKSRLKANIEKIKIPYFNKITNKLEVKRVTQNAIKCRIMKKIKDFLKQYIFFPDVLCEGIKNCKTIKIGQKEYDYIISSSDSKSSHFIARTLIKNNNLEIPWIQIWGDPWQKDIGLTNVNYFLKRKIKKAEKRLLKEATKVFYISELTAIDIKKSFPEMKDKINFLLRSYLEKIESQVLVKDKYTFSYTGSISNRNLNCLLNSVKEYNSIHEKKIEVQFYGVNSNDKKSLQKLNFVKIFPRVSFEKVLDVYKNSDVLVYIDNMGDTTQIPGKIYDYFGTDKVILGLYENRDIKKFLEQFNRIELYRNIEKINLENVVKKIGNQKPVEKFSPKYVACEFLNKIEGV
ncbi:hypothetical protein [uncultured Fusobacterium sp.]|uniref:hypothetical protein n=1 Tax=uncultured Fusobacterium sp. TaxID=159267 RepID=UPI002599F1B3|nr:hypothetical protein [uncultured Fusobacterium sp.]